jgi:hypothetical protein
MAASCGTLTETVALGQGKHAVFIPQQNRPYLTIFGNITFSLQAIGAVCSKTSFAITLIRIIQGRMKILLWVIITLVNIFIGLPAILVWVRCNPPAKVWQHDLEGTCWPEEVYPDYTMFASSELRQAPWTCISINLTKCLSC